MPKINDIHKLLSNDRCPFLALSSHTLSHLECWAPAFLKRSMHHHPRSQPSPYPAPEVVCRTGEESEQRLLLLELSVTHQV